ncbi:retron Ec67 family RNA-directed DNA polymerase/endonuclease [Achromobacter sp. JUb104]|uniref:retron Ec67 family RNA-directed DNA polymerase/endonuclease n=1 Tax=Achromobacter sp. JUb104 TaxID=2940590 RepID=UPI002169BD94|nr:retron Ec67 family RNA-directed DNA polymerase/endonuclease [Achromobacter sp. JUb104]MCS3505209.1 hypothetical protein [Achromobacter sp. JUb104]
MTKLEQLRRATTLRDLAELLGVTAPGLAYILYHKPRDQLYRAFEIPKRKGGTRSISAPADELKTIQKKLSCLLQECWAEIGDGKNSGRHPGRKGRVAHGFLPGRSISTNARQHRRKRFVFNVDLEDFFGSINFGRVFGLLRQDNNFKLQPRVAAVIATIACFENKLPQGSPCSPIISNLVARILDARIAGLAAKVGVNYSRYADDLSFSCNGRIFPPEIAKKIEGDDHSWVVGKALNSVIEKTGYRVNLSKTRMQYEDSRQEVTGLVVNRRVNVRSEYRRAVRAMGHRLFSTGAFDVPKIALTKGNDSPMQSVQGTIPQLHGMMSFVASIDRLHREAALSRGDAIEETSAEKLYRNFLYYRFFYKNDAPIILCEGITDNIYLRCAIRALRESYPLLVKPKAEPGDLLIKFYKYRGAAVDTVLKLKDGGAGNLQNFMVAYKKACQLFLGAGKENPVIVIVDNDEGGRKVMGAAKELSGKAYDGSQPYLHVFGNLYLIATHPTAVVDGGPKKMAQKGARPSDSCIEEYFSSEVRSTKLNGKTLTLKNDSSGVAHYGKMDFAKHIVENLRGADSFSGFARLLDRINLVVTAHASSSTEAAVSGAAASQLRNGGLGAAIPAIGETIAGFTEIAEAAD